MYFIFENMPFTGKIEKTKKTTTKETPKAKPKTLAFRIIYNRGFFFFDLIFFGGTTELILSWIIDYFKDLPVCTACM